MTTNQTKVYQLFKEIFGQINFSNIDVTLESNSNLKTIQYLLTTQMPDIIAMLNIITIYFNNNYNTAQVANIFYNLGIITDITNPNFISKSMNSISASNNSFNNLSRSLENANYFASIEPSILDNGSNILDFQKYTTIDQSNNNLNNFDQNYFSNILYPNILNPNQFLEYSNQNLQYFNQSPQYSNQLLQYSQMVQQPTTFQMIQPVEKLAETLQTPINLSQTSQLPEDGTQYLESQQTLNQQASDLESINIELNKKIVNLQYQLNLIKSNSTFDCKNKIDKASKDLSYQINNLKAQGTHVNNNYLQLLFDLLLNNQLITLNEVENINRKLKSGDVDINTIVLLLERKKELAKISFPNFNDIYLKKWTTPLPRPPICLSDNPIKLKQNDIYANNYSSFN